MATYKTKKKAQAALNRSGSFQTEADARNYLKTTAVSYGWPTVGWITIIRVGAVGSGSKTCEVRWTCTNDYSQIKDFEVDIEYYNTRVSRWLELNNSTTSVNKTSYIWQNGIVYTYTFDAPDSKDVSAVRACARPRSDTHKVTSYYYTVEGSGKKWTLKQHEVTEDGPWFNDVQFSAWAQLSPAPALQDSNDAEAKLRAAKPNKPAKPSATLLSNGAIEVTFSNVAPDTADTCRVVYRCQDGKYTSAGSDMSGHIRDQGVSAFVDSKTAAGHEYRYYVRAHNHRGNGTWCNGASLPADLCATVKTRPVQVENMRAACYGDDGATVSFSYPTSAYFPALEEAKVYYADSKAVLTTNKTACQSVDVALGSRNMSAIVTGLEAGKTWYFAAWVKTGSDTQQALFCSAVASCTIATTPDPPTLLPIPRSAVLGESIVLEWVHNNADKSAQRQAQVSITARAADQQQFTTTINVTTDEHVTIPFPASTYSDQMSVSIKVRTKGAGNNFGDWSEDAHLTLYARPFTTLQITNADQGNVEGLAVTTLPVQLALAVQAREGTLSQSVVQWAVTIRSAEMATYLDMFGNEEMLAPGEVVCEVTVDSFEDDFTQPEQTLPIGATDAVFVNGVSYDVEATALMDSGIETDKATARFTCDFANGIGSPTAYVQTAPDWSARIYPSLTTKRPIADGEDYVVDGPVLRVAEIEEGEYTLTLAYVKGDEGAQVSSMAWDGHEFDFAMPDGWTSVTSLSYDDGGEPVEMMGQVHEAIALAEDVTLSVYRVGRDGEMDLVAKDYPNRPGVFVVDRHPTFGEMNYRIIANSMLTDEITAADTSGSNRWRTVLIQWAEEDAPTEPEFEDDTVQFAFEFVELPWNITVNQSSSKDVALKNYVGRRHPVSLYGTQVGETGSWTCRIIKYEEDRELTQLRKLAGWMGDCWVRDPSGLSYPANVNVSITRAFDDLGIDISLEVTRVDGD